MRRGLLLALLPLLLLGPRAAEACAVCSSGREDENRTAFLVTTLFLSALPWTLVGGMVFWLRRRARKLAEAAPPEVSRTASSP